MSSSVCDCNESDLLAEQATVGKQWNCDSCMSRILVYEHNLFVHNEAMKWIRNNNNKLNRKIEYFDYKLKSPAGIPALSSAVGNKRFSLGVWSVREL